MMSTSNDSTAAPAASYAHRPGAREFARLERALPTLSAGNRTLLRASNEQELLQDMCDVIVDVGGYHLAAVVYVVDDARKSLRWMANVAIETGAFETAQ